MNQKEQIAAEYFEAFHNGQIANILGYFSENGVVCYGTEPPKKAADFFEETKEMIAGITFETHGFYSSAQTNNVIIHFSFEMPNDEGSTNKIEAIDIIEFNDSNQIVSVKVIPNE